MPETYSSSQVPLNADERPHCSKCGAEMNGPIHTLSVPAKLKTFEEPSCLLPGESRKEFEIVRRMVIEDIDPKTNLEWLWILDLTELSWEILRYRRLKEKVLQTYRASAIAALLRHCVIRS